MQDFDERCTAEYLGLIAPLADKGANYMPTNLHPVDSTYMPFAAEAVIHPFDSDGHRMFQAGGHVTDDVSVYVTALQDRASRMDEPRVHIMNRPDLAELTADEARRVAAALLAAADQADAWALAASVVRHPAGSNDQNLWMSLGEAA